MIRCSLYSCIAAALLLSGCRAGRDVAPAHSTSAANIAQVPGAIAQPDETTRKGDERVTKGGNTAPVPPAPDAPRWQHKEYRKNLDKKAKADAKVAKAQPRTVPLFQGRAAVNAPLATSAVAAYKPAAPVVLATDSATVQVAVAAKGAQAAAGEGNVQQRTDVAATPWWRTLLNWWPAVALAGVAVWFFWPAILALLRRLV